MLMNIYYLATLITEDEITEQQELIFKIIANQLHAPQVKRLNGITFQGQPVYRAKIDKKNRLIFMRIMHGGKPALLILNQNDHNYDELARKLSGTNTHKIKSFDFEAAPSIIIPPQSEERFLPVTVHQEQIFFLDEEQQQAANCSAPLLMSGPPGAGKTLVIYDLLHNYLNNSNNLHWVNEELGHGKKVLFISQSANLIKKIQQHYSNEMTSNIPVDFFTLEQILLTEHKGSTLLPVDAFSSWLKNVFPQGDSAVIHYELSLIAALGAEEYLKLGKRECYLSGKTKEQQRVINLLAQWRNHLKTKHWLDPLTTEITLTNYGAIFCDESQNFSPLTLAALVQAVRKSKQFFACFDDEQAFFSWPYTRGCLLRLLTKQFKDYQTLHLKKTWRCAARIAEVASHLLTIKHKLDGNQAKREYNILESHLSPDSGLVQIVDSHKLEALKPRGNLAETVIIVLSSANPEERAKIQLATGSSNILTPEEAIGLDFNTVILWKPIATQKILHKITAQTNGLNLDEWKLLTRLYVAITRARQELFIYEPELTRFYGQLQLFFGTLQQDKIVPTAALIDEHNKRKWKDQVDYHLEKKQFAAARAILKNHLHYTDDKIELRINPPSIAPIPIVPTPKAETSTKKVTKTRNRKTTNRNTKPVTNIPELPSSIINTTESGSITTPESKPLKDVLTDQLKNYDGQPKIFLQYLGHRSSVIRQQFNEALEHNWKLLNLDELFTCIILTEDHLARIAQSEEGRWLIKKIFLEELSNYRQEVLIKAILPIKKKDSDNINYNTALLFFCKSKDGCQYLNAFFIRNPNLLNLFEAWHLDTPSRLFYPPTPFRELIKTEIGQSIIYKYFLSESIVKDLQHHNLYNGTEFIEGALFPPASHLIQTTSGLKILDKIYQKNPLLADRSKNNGPQGLYYFDNLFKIIPKANIKNISPFFTLCLNPMGRILIQTRLLNSLKHMAVSNPFKIKFIDTFTSLIRKENKNLANTSCIHHLCIDEAGQKILSVLRENFPLDINLKTLLLKRSGPDVAGIGATTPLQILCRTEFGISLLYNWDFIKSEEFARIITESDFSETQNASCAPLFDNLCRTKEGREILYIWIEFNPNIITKLSLNNSSALASLYNTLDGRRIIEQLKNTKLFKELTLRGAQVQANIEAQSVNFFKPVSPSSDEEKPVAEEMGAPIQRPTK